VHRLRGVFFAALGAEETQIEASFCEAIRIVKEQKSVSLEKRAKATYAEYRRQKASGSGGTWIPTTSLLAHPAPYLTSPWLARKTQRVTEGVDHAPDLGERVGTGAAARAPVPRRRPAARRVDGRPAKPARRCCAACARTGTERS
jgi:hypothetical protein